MIFASLQQIFAAIVFRSWQSAILFSACWLLVLQTACTTPTPAVVIADPKPISSEINPPPAPREFRAAWVATVSNIDWPSRASLSSAQQQAEIISILERAKEIKLNAIILQVRPSADAIYPSALEPWSEYLTGEQDKAPQPWYDPLQFWIEQAHSRGLELHAWFNPYRAKAAISKSNLSAKHLSNSAPSAVKKYGDLLWMDPSSSEAANQTLQVISDVVRRYDIDGVHIDDYFYPYPIKNEAGQEVDFPDEDNWQRYTKSGGVLSRADWRRQHVNHLVENIAHRIRQEKSWVKFGISPFGIGKPSLLPPGIAGFSQYDKLYADVELWLAQGWLDYLAPQLYWPIAQSAQAFRVLNGYWLQQNTQGRHIWPGLYTSRLDDTDKSWASEEILNQVQATREQANAGHIHFSMAALLQNRKQIADRLSLDSYTTPALVPESPWLSTKSLHAPKLAWSTDAASLEVTLDDASGGHVLAIWKRYSNTWVFSVQSSSENKISLMSANFSEKPQDIVVSQIDRAGRESSRARIGH